MKPGTPLSITALNLTFVVIRSRMSIMASSGRCNLEVFLFERAEPDSGDRTASVGQWNPWVANCIGSGHVGAPCGSVPKDLDYRTAQTTGHWLPGRFVTVYASSRSMRRPSSARERMSSFR